MRHANNKDLIRARMLDEQRRMINEMIIDLKDVKRKMELIAIKQQLVCDINEIMVSTIRKPYGKWN